MNARAIAVASLVAGSLLAAGARAAEPAPEPPIVKPEPIASPTPTPTPTPTMAPARTLAGTVRSVETMPRRMVLDGGGDGIVTVLLDRNTAVYAESGTGTVRDLRPGVPVRVSVAGAEARALWVEVGRSERTAAPSPAGAAGGAGSGEAGAAAPGDSGSGDSGSGESGRGGRTTPPVSPGLPPRAPPPSPPGPGPVPGGPVGPDSSTGTAPRH